MSTTTYPSWAAARRMWLADRARPRRYLFPCTGCGQPIKAAHDAMPTLSGRGGFCPACHDAEKAMYRKATPDDFLAQPMAGDA